MSRDFKNNASNSGLVTFQWLMKILPRFVMRAIFEGLWFIAYIFIRRLREICDKNIDMVYSSEMSLKERKKLTKMSLKNIGLTMIDLLYYVNHADQFSKKVGIHHEERLKKALSLRRGVIAVTAHLGNFGLMFVGLVQKGYKVNVIIRPMRDNNFSKFMHDLCVKWNVNMIQTVPRKKFVQDSLGALSRNEILFVLSDEVVTEKSGVEVDFFNHKVFRSKGPFLFQSRLKSPILPIFVIKDKQSNFNIFIEPEIEITTHLDDKENKQKNIGRLTKVIECFVRKYPIQWGGWSNKRWTTAWEK